MECAKGQFEKNILTKAYVTFNVSI